MLPIHDACWDTNGREIVQCCTYAVSRDLLFKAWTEPGHLRHWWDHRGITDTLGLDLRAGGIWRFSVISPDGIDAGQWIRYRNVDRPRRLVYDHAGGAPDMLSFYQVTATFDETLFQTDLLVCMEFPDKQACDALVRSHAAIERGAQTFIRLGEYLATIPDEGHPIPPLSEGFISVHARLPIARHVVSVQCAAFRLLGYMDSHGIWRDQSHDRVLFGVIGWRMLDNDARR